MHTLESLVDPDRSITYGVVKPGDQHPNGVRLIRGGDILNGRILIDQLRTISPELSNHYKRTVLRGGELIISLVGNPGHVAVVPERLAGANLARQAGLVALRQTEISAVFLKYYLMSPQGRADLLSQSTGSVQIVINLADLRRLRVPLAPLKVQHRIASILSAYDDLIENCERRIRVLDEMARALYREWFVLFRYPGHENTPLVDSPMGRIPKGWEVHKVEEIIQRISSGKKYEQKTVAPTGSVPVLDQGKSGVIGYHDDEPGVTASESSPVIVFANHTCHQRLIQFPFSSIQNVLPFLPSPSIPRSIHWLHWATNGIVVFNDYKGHWPEFVAKTLVVPSAEPCQQFGDVVAPVSRKIFNLEQRIQNLRKTRDLLLPRLLSGQLPVEVVP